MEVPMNKRAIKAAFPATIPVLTGYVVLGIGFGILLESKGFPWYWATLMAVFIYAGSMQYAGINLLAGGAGLLTTAFMTFVINFRHLFYGIAMLRKYKDSGRIRPLLIWELTDETFSLLCRDQIPEGVDANDYYLATSVLDHLYWVAGCTIGGLLGSMIEFNTKGIDFVMTALFIVIFTEQWLSTKDHRPACIGLFATLLCLPVFVPSDFIIPSMLLITVLLTAARRFLEPDGEDSCGPSGADGSGISADAKGAGGSAGESSSGNQRAVSGKED